MFTAKISIFTQCNEVKCLFPIIDSDTALVLPPPRSLLSNVERVLGIVFNTQLLPGSTNTCFIWTGYESRRKWIAGLFIVKPDQDNTQFDYSQQNIHLKVSHHLSPFLHPYYKAWSKKFAQIIICFGLIIIRNHCPTHTFEPNARKVVLGHWSQRALLEEVSPGLMVLW